MRSTRHVPCADYRFDGDGVGLGLEGRKDDTTLAMLIHGKGNIVRGVYVCACATRMPAAHAAYVGQAWATPANMVGMTVPAVHVRARGRATLLRKDS